MLEVQVEQQQNTSHSQRDVASKVDLQLVRQQAWRIGECGLRRRNGILWRDERHQLESRPIYPHRHGESLESGLFDSCWVPVLAIIVVVTANRHVSRVPSKARLIDSPENGIRFQIIEEEPCRFAPQQILVSDSRTLEQSAFFS